MRIVSSGETSRSAVRRSPGASAVIAAAVTVLALLITTSGGAAQASPKVATASPAVAKPMVVADDSPWTTWEYNPWGANFVSSAGGFAILPLALNSWPHVTKYIPVLASSWTVKGNELVLKLRKHVKWQNGAPFTSTDLVDTLLLDGAAGNTVWDDITNITAPNAHEVVFTIRSGIAPAVVENNVFTLVTPYPASVFGKYVIPGMKQDDLTYYKESLTNQAAANNSSAYKALNAAYQKLVKFNPKHLVGDGPYKLMSITTQEAKYVKWKGFYDAAHITVPEILVPGYQQPTVNEVLLSGTADFSSGWLYMPTAIVERWTHTAQAHLRAVPGTFEGQIIFNDSTYPYNLTVVRQALAYALNISAADHGAWGVVSPHASPPPYPDGLVPPVADQYLTKSQLASLNPYHHSTAKATKLLESVGFHKVGGQWMLPNGKPWAITLSINAAWTDQILAFKVFDAQLKSFGVKATLETVGSDAFTANWPTGNFTFSAYCCEGGSPPDPLLNLSEGPIGPSENYIASGTNKGERGIAYGPTVNVPGLGKVNVPQTLSSEAATISPGPQMKQLTWDWARLVDQQLPFIEYAVFNNQIAYSTKNYTWPSTKNPLWEAVNNGNEAIVLFQERGAIKPKK